MVHKILTLFLLGAVLVLPGCQIGPPADMPLPDYAEKKADPVSQPSTSTVPVAEYAN